MFFSFAGGKRLQSNNCMSICSNLHTLGKRLPSANNADQSQKYRAMLTVSRVLSGDSSVGADVRQAERYIPLLAQEPGQRSEWVALKGCLELVEEAQKLLPKAIIKMEKHERDKKLQDIWDHIDGVPSTWGVALVSCHLEDSLIEDLTPESAERLVEAVWPEHIPGELEEL